MARNNSRFGAVILAAGMSSRMGQAKQLVRLGDNTVLGQVLENVRGSRVQDMVLVLGHEAEKIREQISTGNLTVAINDSYRLGMGTSLRAGLGALPPEVNAALIVLADQPFVGPATLNLLMDRYMQSGAQIVIPTFNGFRGNPVLLDRSVFPEVMALTGDIGCRAIFGNHLEGIVKLPVEDIGILLDLDSKDDLQLVNDFRAGSVSENVLIETANRGGREIPASAESRPARELVIVGREPVALALAKLAKMLRFSVTFVDPLAKASDFPDADRLLHSLDFSQLAPAVARYVVVASRGKFDEEAIEQALQIDSNYVALVANKKRAQEIRRSLELQGESAEKFAKVRAPAGLSIGAEGAEEIALSILAEIVAESHRARESKSSAGSA